MICLIAAEENIAGTIKAKLQKMNSFGDWTFNVCLDSNGLKEWTDKSVDVLVLSRFLPGSDPVRLLPQLRILFPTAHVVILVGQVTESCRAYMRAAAGAGLHNTVTGKLPGDRPYTLVVALTRSKKPELDGYDDLGDVEAGESVDEDMNSILKEQDDLKEEIEEAPIITNNRPEIPPRRTVKEMPGVLVVSAANKGGVGKTTTAIAVATALAKAGIPTALVDFDLGAPDVATFFKIKDSPGVEKLANQNRINPAQIERLFVTKGNLYVLPGVMNKTLPRFKEGELAAILDYLKQKFSVVVCDTSPEPWTKRWLYEVFEMADMALAVVDQSMFSEEETQKYAPTLLAMGVTPEKIRIVVNRYSAKLHNIRVVEVAFNSGFKKGCKALPRVGAIIPENWNAAVQDTYKGNVAGLEDAGSPWHRLAQEIAGMAGYRYERPESRGKNTGGLLNRLLGGRK
jgi:cellulose biosynthesis protein BcsQ/DNA-binding NarL/FixJ family response regulator